MEESNYDKMNHKKPGRI